MNPRHVFIVVIASSVLLSCQPTIKAIEPPPDQYGVDIAEMGDFTPSEHVAVYLDPNTASDQVDILFAGTPVPFASEYTSSDTTWLCVRWDADSNGMQLSWSCQGWVIAMGDVRRTRWNVPDLVTR